jgi:hypothetical protein
MLVTTETGSVYELDLAGRRVRRLNGTLGTSERAGHSGEWRSFLEITDPQVGESMMIAWRYNTETDILETTLTSLVVEVTLEPLNA